MQTWGQREEPSTKHTTAYQNLILKQNDPAGHSRQKVTWHPPHRQQLLNHYYTAGGIKISAHH